MTWHVTKSRTTEGEWRWRVCWRSEGRGRERWFRRAKDADAYRRKVESDQVNGTSVDPDRGAILFGHYAEDRLATRRRVDGRPLAPRTVELYRALLDRRLLPEFARAPLTAIRPERVRAWHAEVTDSSTALQAAKAYRLLRAILNTAVEDGRLPANPCRVRGGGVERRPERPFVDAEIVVALANAIEPRYRALLRLAGFGGLRLGELLALKPTDIELKTGIIRVHAQAVELKNGERIVSSPKTDGGRRRFTSRPSSPPLSRGAPGRLSASRRWRDLYRTPLRRPPPRHLL